MSEGMPGQIVPPISGLQSEVVEVLSREAALELTVRLREGTVRVVEAMGDVEADFTRAYAGRIWISLGYGSWDEYCAAELSNARLWQTAGDRRDRVARFLEAGLSQRAVGALLGVGLGTVQRDLALSTDPNGSVDNANQGSVTGVDGRLRPGRRARPEEILSRQALAFQLWRGGSLGQVQIADRLGVTQGTVSKDLAAFGEIVDQLDPGVATRVIGVVRSADAGDPEGWARVVEEVAAAAGLELMRSDLAGDHVGLARRYVEALGLNAEGLREEVVDADGWTEGGWRDQVGDAVGVELVAALRQLAYCVHELPVEGWGVPGSGWWELEFELGRLLQWVQARRAAGQISQAPGQVG